MLCFAFVTFGVERTYYCDVNSSPYQQLTQSDVLLCHVDGFQKTLTVSLHCDKQTPDQDTLWLEWTE